MEAVQEQTRIAAEKIKKDGIFFSKGGSITIWRNGVLVDGTGLDLNIAVVGGEFS